MMRNTPSARLLGHLVMWVRWAGTGASIRATAEAAGLPAATVAQIEKGQRALKEPKIEALARALAVDTRDLTELWELCQGLVQDASGRRAFYIPKAGSTPPPTLTSRDRSTNTQGDQELDPPFWLASRICAVMSRLIPGADFEIQPARPDDPIPHALGFDDLSEAPMDPSRIPVLWVLWNDPKSLDPVAAVELPFINRVPEGDRRPSSMASSTTLVELIQTLTGAERERVRGYVEAVIDQRVAL